MPNILLSHNPDIFPRAAALGIELGLAGHTHGGQIRFVLGNRLPFGPEGRGDGVTSQPRTSAFLYVNGGLGTCGLPVRLGVPPEITVLTLRKAG
jgi:uncharacterized protein